MWNVVFIDSLIEQQQQSITTKKANTVAAVSLYNALLPDYLAHYVLLSPDGVIHQVAFDALKDNGK